MGKINSTDKLSASEAIFGFVGWLSGRKEVTTMSSKDDCAPLVPLMEEFIKTNNLDPVREDWTNNLTHPS